MSVSCLTRHSVLLEVMILVSSSKWNTKVNHATEKVKEFILRKNTN